MAKKVTQYDIAKYLNICQGTVSKILTGYDQDTFPEDTKRKVIAAAKQFGYVHPSLIIPKRRESDRKSINADAVVSVVLNDGSVFAEYRAKVCNVGLTGLVVHNFEGDRRVFPIDPFMFDIRVCGSLLDMVRVRAKPVRLERNDVVGMGFAVEFVEIGAEDKQRIQSYLDSLPEISSKMRRPIVRRPRPDLPS